MTKDGRLRVVVLAPNPVHPGGVTQTVDCWRKSGIEREIDFEVIDLAAMDSRLTVQLAQTARAFLQLAMQLARRERRPDAVHLNVSTGASVYRDYIVQLTVRAFGVPTVIHLHSGGFESWIDRAWHRKRVAKSLFSSSTVAVVVAHRWVPLVSGLGAKRVWVIPAVLPPALERSLWQHATVRRNGNVRERRGTGLLFYGRWSPIKGLDVLADAIAGLDPERQSRVTLRIFGNGDRDWLDQCFRSVRHAHIEIGGWLDDVKKGEELERADAFVLASRHEGFPQSLLEVKAAQVPLIASDTGGVPEAVGDYPLALLVPPEDPQSLRSALRRLLDGTWPEPLVGGRCLGIPERHSAPVALSELKSAYEYALGESERL